MPGQLFYSTGIPVCLWFVSRNKSNSGFRNRRGEILFIDARQMGELVDRVHRELSDDDVKKIADTYHAWRGEPLCPSDISPVSGDYCDIKGFCKSAKLEEVQGHEYILTPGRYVGIEDVAEDSEPFDEKMGRLTAELAEQFAKSSHLEKEIRENLGAIGYEF